MNQITLTSHQQEAYNKIVKFILDPAEPAMVLEGPAGTGKTTIISTIVNNLDKIEKTCLLITGKHKRIDLEVTATTNPATQVLNAATNFGCVTTQSLFSMKPEKDYTTGKSELVRKANITDLSDLLIIVDEPSYINNKFLSDLFKYSIRCKFIFTGDPYQLVDWETGNSPVFSIGYPTVKLTELVRASDPLLKSLVMSARQAVIDSNYFSFTPDNNIIKVLSRDAFNNELGNNIMQPNWNNNTSKYLCWTNKEAVTYNELATSTITGSPKFKVGDLVRNNKFFKYTNTVLKADDIVKITHVRDETSHGLKGKKYTLNNLVSAFMPDSLESKQSLYTMYKKNQNYHLMREIDDKWIDLRANYASTVYKAQGSTYETVFIDLDNLKKCTNKNQLFRLLYVAVSRASKQIVFTGDLV